MPGIFFLSGEMPLATDNEEDATINLNMMHKLYPSLPWHVSFSYGKALQKVSWRRLCVNVSRVDTMLRLQYWHLVPHTVSSPLHRTA